MIGSSPKVIVTEFAGPPNQRTTADLIAALMHASLRYPGGGGSDAFAGEVWSSAAVGELLSLPGTHCFLASLDDSPAGYLLARLVEDEGDILSVGVCPAYRRRGLAHALLSRLAIRALEIGVRRLFLEVAESNAAARACYLADGWREVARRPGYYELGNNKHCDALVFSLALTD